MNALEIFRTLASTRPTRYAVLHFRGKEYIVSTKLSTSINEIHSMYNFDSWSALDKYTDFSKLSRDEMIQLAFSMAAFYEK
jgi:hypothetical protein